ncbi:MAG: hypothetical protein J2P58_14785, partial [Acidimicrobiaceae bacterium]|nr:hypothetical protein [Acidimicrobiaceae bacterium]
MDAGALAGTGPVAGTPAALDVLLFAASAGPTLLADPWPVPVLPAPAAFAPLDALPVALAALPVAFAGLPVALAASPVAPFVAWVAAAFFPR